MARVNITVPDDLLERSKAAGLNVSRVSSDALSEELDRRERIVALDRYLRALDVEMGPVPSEEQAAAREWADRALGDAGQRTPIPAHRTA